MTKRLVIVESPTKARTIEKYLGSDYQVEASYGHIRDLPNNASEIPEEVKKEKWSRLGVNVENNFEPLYVIPDSKKKRVAELKRALKDADELFLATDEDREGESISWHLLEVLNPKVPVKRMVFHEITKSAIKAAIDNPRDIDTNLVKAQEARRMLDRLYGYSVSPLLWKKMRPRLSAGRVQSVAMRLLVERERERIAFRSADFWDLTAEFAKQGGTPKFPATLITVSGKRVALGKDFDPKTGKLLVNPEIIHLNQEAATALHKEIQSVTPVVRSVEEKPFTSKPMPPFSTSSLQQDGNRKLGFAARKTMSTAQILYENGFITYMRTDSTNLSDEALKAARATVTNDFGAEFLHPEPRLYRTQVKNAQEAHEAIRPAGSEFAAPDTVRAKLGADAGKLYDLIWKRTLASQMKDAQGLRTTALIDLGKAGFRSSGKVITSAGFLRAYVESFDEGDANAESEEDRILPKLAAGEGLETAKLEAVSHSTQSPARFTEGSLIKELERLGIGRPSTWATIVDLVLSRDYAFKRGQALVPTHLAMALCGLLEGSFTQLIDYQFTAKLEDDLDAISRGESDSLSYLKKFYIGNGHPGLATLVKKGEAEIDPRVVCGLPIGEDSAGLKLEVRIGKFGPFISNGTIRAGLPDELAPDELTVEKAQKLLLDASRGPESIGNDPATNKPVYVKSGRFGPYVQLGIQEEGKDRPKMASLLTGMNVQEITLETALKLLEYPKNLGKNPTTDLDIIASNGKFGPYIKSGEETRSIPIDQMSLLEVTLEKALELLKQPRRRAGQGATPKNLRELGKHPESEAPIVIKSGRFGPYVTDGKVNASIPRGGNPDTLTLDEAVSLLIARAAYIEANGGITKRRGRGGKPTKAAPKAKAAKGAKKAAVIENPEVVVEAATEKPKAKKVVRKAKKPAAAEE